MVAKAYLRRSVSRGRHGDPKLRLEDKPFVRAGPRCDSREGPEGLSIRCPSGSEGNGKSHRQRVSGRESGSTHHDRTNMPVTMTFFHQIAFRCSRFARCTAPSSKSSLPFPLPSPPLEPAPSLSFSAIMASTSSICIPPFPSRSRSKSKSKLSVSVLSAPGAPRPSRVDFNGAESSA
jgi:hypothetical protein